MQLVIIYSVISFLLHNGVKKDELQNIHHKTLRQFGPSSEVLKAGPLSGKSSQHQTLNSMCCGNFFSNLEAVGQVDLTRGWFWLRVVSGERVSYFRLKEIVINYVN
jgi:hypothetical protein